MSTQWLDFKEIKARVPIRAVLDRYGFLDGLSERKPGKLVGACPIHGGTGKASFHVDADKNIWNCFSACHGGGNVLDLVMRVEGCSIREAGEKLADWFGLTFEKGKADKELANVSQETKVAAAGHTTRQDDEGHVVNPPLERPLLERVTKSLDQNHAYLFERGLTVATIKTFGVGVASRGFLRGCCGIPIARADGEVVAFAGRIIDPERAKEGKYKMPAGFQKSHVVWNLNRAREHADAGLVIVEGFFDAMKVAQAGFPNVVALMGSSLSAEQEELLLAHTDRMALMFDGDDAGEKCLRDFYGRLRHRVYLREISLDAGEQPDSLTEDRIRALLAS